MGQSTLGAVSRGLASFAILSLLWAPLYLATVLLYRLAEPYRVSTEVSLPALVAFVLAGGLLSAYCLVAVLHLSRWSIDRLLGQAPVSMSNAPFFLGFFAAYMVAWISWDAYGDVVVSRILPAVSWPPIANAPEKNVITVDSMMQGLYVGCMGGMIAKIRNAKKDSIYASIATHLGLTVAFAYILIGAPLTLPEWWPIAFVAFLVSIVCWWLWHRLRKPPGS